MDQRGKFKLLIFCIHSVISASIIIPYTSFTYSSYSHISIHSHIYIALPNQACICQKYWWDTYIPKYCLILLIYFRGWFYKYAWFKWFLYLPKLLDMSPILCCHIITHVRHLYDIPRASYIDIRDKIILEMMTHFRVVWIFIFISGYSIFIYTCRQIYLLICWYKV